MNIFQPTDNQETFHSCSTPSPVKSYHECYFSPSAPPCPSKQMIDVSMSDDLPFIPSLSALGRDATTCSCLTLRPLMGNNNSMGSVSSLANLQGEHNAFLEGEDRSDDGFSFLKLMDSIAYNEQLMENKTEPDEQTRNSSKYLRTSDTMQRPKEVVFDANQNSSDGLSVLPQSVTEEFMSSWDGKEECLGSGYNKRFRQPSVALPITSRVYQYNPAA